MRQKNATGPRARPPLSLPFAAFVTQRWQPQIVAFCPEKRSLERQQIAFAKVFEPRFRQWIVDREGGATQGRQRALQAPLWSLAQWIRMGVSSLLYALACVVCQAKPRVTLTLFSFLSLVVN